MRILSLDLGAHIGVVTSKPFESACPIGERYKRLLTGVLPSVGVEVAGRLLYVTTVLLKGKAKGFKVSPLCDDKSLPADRFYALGTMLDFIREELYAPEFVVFEYNPFLRSVYQAEANFGYLGILLERLAGWSVPFDGVKASTLKAHIFKGSPKGTKRDKSAAEIKVRESFSTVRNDHEAHAVALVDYYITEGREEKGGNKE